jgi:hypothetical protein
LEKETFLLKIEFKLEENVPSSGFLLTKMNLLYILNADLPDFRLRTKNTVSPA